ncbi:hydroxyisourate hydrolase [Tahibacter amnicola]|uniref:5-hydroxyisourate hydrolase n=1 Tax=Tahibacter amnicola TaxID=2976241 RepID=A0ABY6BF67_9GAMM|nr:hydroxyisourate hydrolase [Tahibacter amnicola]UXI68674.1 hydroxyisourate hydrolase [Tahibacter amnicola]
MGRLTTHVLDTAQGKPGAGIRIDLYRLDAGQRRPLAQRTTNVDGRCDEPLLAGAALLPGTYELDFHLGAYFKGAGIALADPPFIDVVTLRFGMADADSHYHVPLLASPYSYSTYRGS